MSKLIDEQAAYDVLTDYYHHSTDTQHAALREALGRVESVDAVSVVRCKDCKHYRPYAGIADGYCRMAEWYKRYQYENDFCSRGERRDVEHETD